MHYVDRFSSTLGVPSLRVASKDDFQLLSMAALSLALKLYDHRNILVPGANSTLETILLLSRGKFVLAQLEEMELKLLTRLEWLSFPPTPQMFVGYILRAYFPSPCHTVRDISIFCVELTVLDYYFVPYSPSEVALAGLLQAVKTLLSSPMHRGLTRETMESLNSRLVLLENDRVRSCHHRLERLYSSSAGDNTDLTGAPENPPCSEDRAYSPISVSNFDHAVFYSS